MNYVILFFGILIVLLGAMILVKPDPFFAMIRSNSESTGLRALAVMVRLILGVALITYATTSKYPVALQILGWVLVTAAIILAAVGHARFKSLITWALSFSSSFDRFAGFFAILFGGFLIYPVV